MANENGEVIDFVILRIQAELDKYQKNNTLPQIILDGSFSLEEITERYAELPKKYQKLVDRLKRDYYSNVAQNKKTLLAAFRKDYTHVFANLTTEHPSFVFPAIMRRYRKDINPVRALYYDTREVFRSFNPESQHHVWVASLVTDLEYNNIIQDALERDIESIEALIKQYYAAMVKVGTSMPMELVHAKLTVKEFRQFLIIFQQAKNWLPDE